jgi:hypothetical protein
MKKILVAAVFLVSLFTFSYTVNAQNERVCDQPGTLPCDCTPPQGIPTACPTDFEPDHLCNIAKIKDPTVICCPNKCIDAETSVPQPEQDELRRLGNIFGTEVRYTPEKIPSLIQLGISAVLAVVSFYALFRGMFLYAIKRPNTIDASEIANINKEFGNIIIGFVLAWSVIFLVEFVMRILGLPSLSQIDIARIDESDGANVIIIQ